MFSVKSYKGEYGVEFADDLPIPPDNSFVIIDEFIYDHFYGDKAWANMLMVTAGEETKTVPKSMALIDFLIENGFQKKDVIYCIGGGTIQDLVSFAASILYRGVHWEFYPTTLLAQCDSCIGSKSAINHGGCKNIIGGFHPARAVKIFPGFLDTLHPGDVKSGIGEMLHYFVLEHDLASAASVVKKKDLKEHIRDTLLIKKRVIELDEFDKGERNLFNYGHTFGHALETLTDYAVNHGQAVTAGMHIANKISLSRGLIDDDLYKKIDEILAENMPEFEIRDHDAYLSFLKRGKLNVSDKLTCILLDMERAQKIQIEYDEVLRAL